MDRLGLRGINILVTGASGFVASHLLRHLASREARPVGWSRSYSESVTGIEHRTVDLANADAVCRGAAASGQVDGIVHLASGGRMLTEQGMALEVAMWRNLLENFASPERRIVFIGSADQYGDIPAPQAETDPRRGLSPYARAKNECEDLASYWRAERDVDVVTLRPFSIYGPGQPGHMFLSQLLAACRSGRTFQMSEGLQRRDFVHVDDVCDAIVAALTMVGPHEDPINVGTGKGRTLREAARQVVRLTGAAITIEHDVINRSYDPASLFADTRRAREVLNWHARISFDKGIRAIWEQGASGAC